MVMLDEFSDKLSVQLTVVPLRLTPSGDFHR
jgi:hypothetical protein